MRRVEFCVRKIYRRVSESGKIRKKKKIQHREHREKTHRVHREKDLTQRRAEAQRRLRAQENSTDDARARDYGVAGRLFLRDVIGYAGEFLLDYTGEF